MIASNDSFERSSRDQLPSSDKVYISGKIHKDISVPMREISLNSTKTIDGNIEENEAVRVYDTSGPWGDPKYKGKATDGLPALRAKWIRNRNDVEEYNGRKIQPIDNGYLSENHAKNAAQSEKQNRLTEFPNLNKLPLRASNNHPVTQLWYARQGIITAEMEYIAIRENMGLAKLLEEAPPNHLHHQHEGNPWGAKIPK